jgi:hypothetical protein
MKVRILAGFMLVALLAFAGFVLAKHQQRPKTETLVIGVDGVVIDHAACDEPGIVHVKAHATVKGTPLYVRQVWWEVAIRTVHQNPTLERTIWTEPYDAKSFVVRDGATLRPTLDDVFALEPGQYWVQVHMRENCPQQTDLAGNVDPTPIIMTNTKLVEVR